MYFGTPPDVLFKAGHDSAGVTAPSHALDPRRGRDRAVLRDVHPAGQSELRRRPTATLRFLTRPASRSTRTVTIPATGRRTVNIEALEPAAPELANAAVATIVTASLPIVAERAQYWPGPPTEWYEAHNSFGVTAPRHALGPGRRPRRQPGGRPRRRLPDLRPARQSRHDDRPPSTITFLRETAAPVVRTFVGRGARRRLNVAVAGAGSTVPELANEMFGALIEVDQPIVVERALYGNAGTQVFGIGTNATATPLP